MGLLILLEQELVIQLHTSVMLDITWLVILLEHVNQVEIGQDHHMRPYVKVSKYNYNMYNILH